MNDNIAVENFGALEFPKVIKLPKTCLIFIHRLGSEMNGYALIIDVAVVENLGALQFPTVVK